MSGACPPQVVLQTTAEQVKVSGINNVLDRIACIAQTRSIATDGIAWSNCMCVDHDREPCRNWWTDRDAVWGQTRLGKGTMYSTKWGVHWLHLVNTMDGTVRRQRYGLSRPLLRQLVLFTRSIGPRLGYIHNQNKYIGQKDGNVGWQRRARINVMPRSHYTNWTEMKHDQATTTTTTTTSTSI